MRCSNIPFYIFIIKWRAVFFLPISARNDILEFYPALPEWYSARSIILPSALLAVSDQSLFFCLILAWLITDVFVVCSDYRVVDTLLLMHKYH